MPATACSAKTSMASSMRIQYFTMMRMVSLAEILGREFGSRTLCGVIGYDARNNAQDDGAPCRAISRRRRGSDETRDGA